MIRLYNYNILFFLYFKIYLLKLTNYYYNKLLINYININKT